MGFKVNDYVRTDKGEIGKVSSVMKEDLGFGDIEVCNTEPYVYGTIIKTSPLIIDLIEVGDYVNGYKVESVDTKYGPYGVYIEIPFVDSESIGCNVDLIRTEEIERIVTREMFEKIEYKLKKE